MFIHLKKKTKNTDIVKLSILPKVTYRLNAIFFFSFVVNQKFNFKTISLIFYTYGATFSEFISEVLKT